MNGIFGNMFDFNHDGELDFFERTSEFAFLNEITAKDSAAQTDFELSGLNAEELEWMDSAERRKTLENAGLDPDGYDF